MGLWISSSPSLLQEATPNTRPPLCLGGQWPRRITLAAPLQRERVATFEAGAGAGRRRAGQVAAGQVQERSRTL